jgi:hypothetical protein
MMVTDEIPAVVMSTADGRHGEVDNSVEEFEAYDVEIWPIGADPPTSDELVEPEKLGEISGEVVEVATLPTSYNCKVEDASMSTWAKWRLWGGGKWFGGLSWREVRDAQTSITEACHYLTVIEARNAMLSNSFMTGVDLEYPFVYEIAAEVVRQLGGRPTSNAQMIAARRTAGRVMHDRDHRLAHIERDMPMVLALIQTETSTEILGVLRESIGQVARKKMAKQDAARRLLRVHGRPSLA